MMLNASIIQLIKDQNRIVGTFKVENDMRGTPTRDEQLSIPS